MIVGSEQTEALKPQRARNWHIEVGCCCGKPNNVTFDGFGLFCWKIVEIWAGRVIECYRKSLMGLFVSLEDSNVESGGPDHVSERSKDFIRNWTRSRLWAILVKDLCG